MGNSTLVSFADFARTVTSTGEKISRQAIREACGPGKWLHPALVMCGKVRKLDLEKALACLKNRNKAKRARAKRGNPKTGDTPPFIESQAFDMAYRAQQRLDDLRIRRGELIERKPGVSIAEGAGLVVRRGLEGLPSRLAGMLEGKDYPERVEIIQDEVHRIIRGFQDEIRKL